MSFEIIQRLREKPDQVIPQVDYHNMCSFVNGFFFKSKELSVFREWLALKLGKRTPFWWPGIILQIEFGFDHSVRIHGDDSLQRKSSNALLDLLEEYLSVVDSDEARELVKNEYQEKLGRNDT